jgi:hypothetical protein
VMEIMEEDEGELEETEEKEAIVRGAECASAANARGEKMDRNKSADDGL